mmetsp:Transcript_143953/g.254393  ORF Transcript_143953/g.254393 Transcript_143953/m.254393 type:complete len:667 (-) Transcript_143953:174-2174(-)
MSSQQPPAAAGAALLAQNGRVHLVNKIVEMIKSRGPKMADEVRKRVVSGEGITIKGFHVDAGVLKDALAAAAASAGASPAASPAGTAAASQVPANPSKPAGPTTVASSSAVKEGTGAAQAPGRRFSATVSTAALASKAILECETAAPYVETIVVVGGSKVAVLPRPDVRAKPTGEYLNAGESAQAIARNISARDGRIYVRLQNYSGWVSTRSRKDFSKVVIAAPNSSAALEPASSAGLLPSRVVKMLPAVSLTEVYGGKDPAAANGDAAPASAGAPPAAAPGVDVRRFRAVGARVPVTSTPSQANGAMSVYMLQSREVFEADGVFNDPTDGRAYLRLTRGRGWVCERSRADFGRFLVEPLVGGYLTGGDEVGVYGQEEKPTMVRQRAAIGKKVIAVERVNPDEVSAEVAAATKRTRERSVNPTLCIFRSDKELWPDELQPPRPIGSETRIELRRIYVSFGKRIEEGERDLKEVTERVDSYARTCPAQKELQKFAEQLRKENSKVQAEWLKAIEAALPDIRKTATSDALASSSGCNGRGGLFPVQVQGERWYCASIPADGEEDDAGPNRHLGPLRKTAEAAAEDLQRMQAHLEEEKSQPKRRRVLDEFRTEELSSLSQAELRKKLSDRGMAAYGSKDDMIKRLIGEPKAKTQKSDSSGESSVSVAGG